MMGNWGRMSMFGQTVPDGLCVEEARKEAGKAQKPPSRLNRTAHIFPFFSIFAFFFIFMCFFIFVAGLVALAGTMTLVSFL